MVGGQFYFCANVRTQTASGKRNEYKQYVADLKDMKTQSDQLKIICLLAKGQRARHLL